MANEKLKQQDKQEQPNQEEKKSSKKIISIFIGLDILLVIIIVLLLCLKSCKNNNNAQESSDGEPIDIERNNRITDLFKGIVKKNIQYGGYDNDNLDKVITITYEDNYPNDFSLNISVTSDTKVYYCKVTDYPYDGNKEEYNNFVSYLLLEGTEYKPTNSYCELHPYSKTDIRVSTSKTTNRYVIGETSSEPKDNYLYGFYKENNEFYIYQDKLIVEGIDPFSNPSNQIIKSDSLLHDYFKGLLVS